MGRSERTNEEGRRQLAARLEGHGYTIVPVDLEGCLHLKTAVTRVGPGLLLIQRGWVDAAPFNELDRVEVAPGEPFAANALWLGGRDVIYPAAFPATAERLEERGLSLRRVDVSEIAKAEGGVTCCSLLLATG